MRLGVSVGLFWLCLVVLCVISPSIYRLNFGLVFGFWFGGFLLLFV